MIHEYSKIFRGQDIDKAVRAVRSKSKMRLGLRFDWAPANRDRLHNKRTFYTL